VENNSLPGEVAQGGQVQPTPSTVKEPRQLLKTGFLMFTSAILGGVAFAFWNKRQIASMKEKSGSVDGPAPSADDDAIY
jgi:hypothetical protein